MNGIAIVTVVLQGGGDGTNASYEASFHIDITKSQANCGVRHYLACQHEYHRAILQPAVPLG